jgi:ATP/maltotriose-dependent transcriptional regulator MalT
LTSEWIQESERADAWLSLDEEDSDPTRSLADFIADMLLKLHRFRIRANVQINDPINIEKE